MCKLKHTDRTVNCHRLHKICSFMMVFIGVRVCVSSIRSKRLYAFKQSMVQCYYDPLTFKERAGVHYSFFILMFLSWDLFYCILGPAVSVSCWCWKLVEIPSRNHLKEWTCLCPTLASNVCTTHAWEERQKKILDMLTRWFSFMLIYSVIEFNRLADM